MANLRFIFFFVFFLMAGSVSAESLASSTRDDGVHFVRMSPDKKIVFDVDITADEYLAVKDSLPDTDLVFSRLVYNTPVCFDDCMAVFEVNNVYWDGLDLAGVALDFYEFGFRRDYRGFLDAVYVEYLDDKGGAYGKPPVLGVGESAFIRVSGVKNADVVIDWVPRLCMSPSSLNLDSVSFSTVCLNQFDWAIWGVEGEVTVESPVNATWPDTYPTLLLPVNVSLRVGALANYSISVDSDQYSFYDSSLKGFYDFEESLTADHSIFDRTTIARNITNTSGKYGSGAYFDLSLYNSGIFIEDNFLFDIKDEGSMGAWVNIHPNIQQTFNMIISSGGGSSLPFTFSQLFYHRTENRYQVFLGDYNISSETYVRYECWADANTTMGDWVRLDYTWNNNSINIYVNGVLDKSCPVENMNRLKVITDNLDVNYTAIGTWARAYILGDSAREINGSIDNAMIYDRMLSADEIAHLFTSDLRWVDGTNWTHTMTLDANISGTITPSDNISLSFGGCSVGGVCSLSDVFLMAESTSSTTTTTSSTTSSTTTTTSSTTTTTLFMSLAGGLEPLDFQRVALGGKIRQYAVVYNDSMPSQYIPCPDCVCVLTLAGPDGEIYKFEEVSVDEGNGLFTNVLSESGLNPQIQYSLLHECHSALYGSGVVLSGLMVVPSSEVMDCVDSGGIGGTLNYYTCLIVRGIGDLASSVYDGVSYLVSGRFSEDMRGRGLLERLIGRYYEFSLVNPLRNIYLLFTDPAAAVNNMSFGFWGVLTSILSSLVISLGMVFILFEMFIIYHAIGQKTAVGVLEVFFSKNLNALDWLFQRFIKVITAIGGLIPGT